jgi:hypothetical protein
MLKHFLKMLKLFKNIKTLFKKIKTPGKSFSWSARVSMKPRDTMMRFLSVFAASRGLMDAASAKGTSILASVTVFFCIASAMPSRVYMPFGVRRRDNRLAVFLKACRPFEGVAHTLLLEAAGLGQTGSNGGGGEARG